MDSTRLNHAKFLTCPKDYCMLNTLHKQTIKLGVFTTIVNKLIMSLGEVYVQSMHIVQYPFVQQLLAVCTLTR